MAKNATIIGFCCFVFAFREPDTRDKAAGSGKCAATSVFHLFTYPGLDPGIDIAELINQSINCGIIR
jgi:hypothetical protein